MMKALPLSKTVALQSTELEEEAEENTDHVVNTEVEVKMASTEEEETASTEAEEMVNIDQEENIEVPEEIEDPEVMKDTLEKVENMPRVHK